MPGSANKQIKSIIEPNVTSISTNARIDYIMRFSKHAVLVVDESSDVYSAVGSQFLGALPSNHNAAFIAISPKLNEIQIRCRLIEQLFVDTLFDPEEALAVTVLKLATDNKEVISIVVENVELLSLQLMHEFCQLAELAAKAGRCVNVLLLGGEKVTELISAHTVVFTNKLSIVSAIDGQLISIDKLASNKNRLKLSTPYKKSMIAIVCLLSATIIPVVFLYQVESPKLSDLTIFTDKNSLNLNTLKREKSSFIKVNESTYPQATSNEIFQNLSPHNVDGHVMEHIEIAEPNEVASVLITEQANSNQISEKEIKEEQIEKEEKFKIEDFESTIYLDTPKVTENNEVVLSESYFQDTNQGYVAQIIGFSKFDTYKVFMEKYKQQNFVSYSRTLNSATVFIITTRAYPMKSDVNTVISKLPIELQENKPWIKSVEAINNEINLHQNTE